MEHKPTINLISAVAEDGAIGKDNGLLWKIPKDLEFYKAKTLGNVVVMGEKTFETLPKVAFRDRTHVVTSVQYACKPSNAHANYDIQYMTNPKYALIVAKDIAVHKKCDVFIAGGASMYEQLMGDCDFAFITWAKKSFPDADKHFPVREFLSTFGLISEGDWSRRTLKIPKHKFSVYKNNQI